MNEGLTVFLEDTYLIIAAKSIPSDLQAKLYDSYKVLSFQLLCEKPILCLCTSESYPMLYPGTAVMPESD